jgi:hypothetical protein
VRYLNEMKTHYDLVFSSPPAADQYLVYKRRDEASAAPPQ